MVSSHRSELSRVQLHHIDFLPLTCIGQPQGVGFAETGRFRIIGFEPGEIGGTGIACAAEVAEVEVDAAGGGDFHKDYWLESVGTFKHLIVKVVHI